MYVGKIASINNFNPSKLNVKKILLKKIRRGIVSFVDLLPQFFAERIYRKMIKFPTSYPKGMTFRTAQTYEEIVAAGKLVHDTYVAMKIKEPSSLGVHVTKYLTMPTSVVILAIYKGQVIGTLTLIRDSFLGLPMEKIADLSDVRATGDSIAEVSALAVCKEYAGDKRVSLGIMRYINNFVINSNRGISRLVISVHPKAKLFYKSIFGFDEIKINKKSDSGYMKGAPACCLTLDMNKDIFLKKLARMYKGARPEKSFLAYVNSPNLDTEQNEDSFYLIENHILNDSELENLFLSTEDIMNDLSIENKFRLTSLYPKESRFKESILKSDSPLTSISFLEKRTFSQRFLVDCPIKITGKNRFILGKVINVSETGCLLKFNNPVEDFPANSFGIVELGPNLMSKIKMKKVWGSPNNFVGVQVLLADQDWKNLISHAESMRSNTISKKNLKKVSGS